MTASTTNRDMIALAAVCLSSLMFGLEISSVPTILPTLETVLPADFKELQWIMNAYTIAVTAVLMATGTLADRYGRKRIFIASIAIFGIASLVCGLSENASVLIASRFLQGMSGGAMLICQIAVLSYQFQQGPGRARAFSTWGIIFGIGLGFGPIIGAAITAVVDWEWVFLVHALLAIATIALAVSGVAESRDPNAGRLDLAGIITLSVAVFCLAYYITQGPALGFTSMTAMLILAASALSFAAFVAVERLSAYPMFDFSVLRIRNFSGALLGSMGMNFSFWPFMIYLPIYFQNGLGYDSVTAGLALLAYTLPTLVAPPLGEGLALRYGPGVVIPGGMFTIGLGFLLMWVANGSGDASWLTMLPGCVISGIGLGLINTPVTNTTTGSVSSTRAGMASGIDMSARMISLAINIALMGFILVEGILSRLASSAPGMAAAPLRALAETVAAGGGADPSGVGLAGDALHNALTGGFGWVMLYGWISVWLLAAASLVIFRPYARTTARDKPEGAEPTAGEPRVARQTVASEAN